MLALHISSTRERDRDCCGGVATSSLAVVTAAGEAPQTLKSADGGPCTTHDLPRIGRRRMHVRLVAQRLVGMNDATGCYSMPRHHELHLGMQQDHELFSSELRRYRGGRH